ncbi:hypothetical protein BH10BAC5_BH10BAC5_16980 [soil metagenome]
MADDIVIPAGTVSLQLYEDIAEELKTKIESIPTKDVVFDKLNEYQTLLMKGMLSTKKKFKIILATGTAAYPLSNTILRTISAKFQVKLRTKWHFSADSGIISIVLDESTAAVGVASSNYVTVEAYLKPIANISSTVDPVCGEDYYPYLKSLYYSRFRKEWPDFDSKETVLSSIQAIINNTRSTDNEMDDPFINFVRM